MSGLLLQRLLVLLTGGLFSLCIFVLNECERTWQIPPDDELIDNFMAHEQEFYEIKNLALKLEEGHTYPPFEEDFLKDTNPHGSINGLSEDERIRLDSLLKRVGCERIYFRSRENYRGVEGDSMLSLTYWSRGLSIGGTWKEYVYKPDWEYVSYRGTKNLYQMKETGDLMEETGYADTIVYKPIKGAWYIEFGHDN